MQFNEYVRIKVNNAKIGIDELFEILDDCSLEAVSNLEDYELEELYEHVKAAREILKKVEIIENE